MTTKTKLLLLLFGLTVPYIAVAMYMTLAFRGNFASLWIPFVGLCYFVVAVFVFVAMRRRIVATSPALDPALESKQNQSAARSLRRLAYVWVVGPLFYLLTGGPKTNPWWVTMLGLSWAGFMIWISFHQARKMELKARQDTQV